jgi:glycosyltransferase involved in cell wall biosynthesis
MLIHKTGLEKLSNIKKDLSKVWLIVPAYNEAKVIDSVIRNALNVFPNIVVVDDCSSDLTPVIANDAGATVVRHCLNLGQGASIQTGIDYALMKNADVIVTFDADGQHRVEDALSILDVVLSGKADIVIGSRFLGIESLQMPFTRRLILKAGVIFTRITTGIQVTDAHNGLRAMSKEAAQKIVITQNRMAHASEIVSQIANLKLQFKEHPIQVLYSDYSLAKGQKASNFINILVDLFFGGASK